MSLYERMHPRCHAEYDGIPRETSNGTFVFTCTLEMNHDGDHEDHVSDAPSVLVWRKDNRPAWVQLNRGKVLR